MTLPAGDLRLPGAPPVFQSTTQTMLWARRERWSAGVGVEQRWQPPGEGQALPPAVQARGAGLLVGVSVGTSERSSLVWQAPLMRAADPTGLAAPERQMRLGLAFQARDPYADLRRGSLMRVELSGPTVFSLRPRGGRLAMVLSSQW